MSILLIILLIEFAKATANIPDCTFGEFCYICISTIGAILLMIIDIIFVVEHIVTEYKSKHRKFRGVFGGRREDKRFTYKYFLCKYTFNKPTTFLISLMTNFIFEWYWLISNTIDIIYWITHVGRKVE